MVKKNHNNDYLKPLYYSIIPTLFIIFTLLYLMNHTPCINHAFKLEYTSKLGDTIGGITNPIIALGAAIITFLAFWAQFKANQAQTEQFDKQAKDLAIERFESKFYQLLNIH